MPKVKVFVKEVIIHEKIVDMPDDYYQAHLDDDFAIDTWAAEQMDETTRKQTDDWIHGEIIKI